MNSRASVLRAALGFLSLEPNEPELQLLHRCFDTWRGVGDVVAGMARQEYDLELRRYEGQGWRAIFFQNFRNTETKNPQRSARLSERLDFAVRFRRPTLYPTELCAQVMG